MQKGLHGRNDPLWPDRDYELVRRAKIEMLVMMSFTHPNVFERLRNENPDIQFIVRLYHPGINAGGHVSARQFAWDVHQQIAVLRQFTDLFAIHNEPNLNSGGEGWGPTREHAESFAAWYDIALDELRHLHPNLRFGFPGLAVPPFLHHDRMWLEVCRGQIQRSDWLGVHSYWQLGSDNMLNGYWGLNVDAYRVLFPDKEIHITEFGDSTPAENWPRENIARDYPVYYRELGRRDWLGSASAYIASSPDPQWSDFVWVKESGEFLPVVDAVAGVEVDKVVEGVPGFLQHLNVKYIADKLPRSDTPVKRQREIAGLVVHHSDTPPGTPPRRVAAYHVQSLGWDNVAYTFGVAENGRIFMLLPLDVKGNHSGGWLNHEYLGIVFLNRLRGTTWPSDAQLDSMGQLIAALVKHYDLSLDDVVGHKKVSSTRCPADTWEKPYQSEYVDDMNWPELKPELASRIQAHL